MRKITFRELKGRARGLLQGKHGFFALATFLMSAFNLMFFYVLASVFPSAGGGLNFILNLACTVLVNIVYFLLLAGLHLIYLQLCRGNSFRLKDLFFAFSVHPEAVAAIAVADFLVQMIPTNLIPWSLAKILFAQKPADILIYLLVLLVSLILTVWIELLFSIALFVYCDAPWKSALQIAKDSFTITRGNKIRILLLEFSFIGMGFLAVISFGIGMLFVQPYLYTTQTLFYLNLRGEEPAGAFTDGL